MMRSLCRIAVASLVVGFAMVGLANPAVAAPSVEFSNRCGFVLVTARDLPAGPTRVFRNGFELDPLQGPTSSRRKRVGAAVGDQIRVQYTGLPAFTHSYQSPAGCVALSLTFTIENACNNVVLIHARNTGPVPVNDFRTVTSDGVLQEAKFPVGDSTWPVAVVAGDKMRLQRDVHDPELGNAHTEWLVHTASTPAGCIANSVVGTFTDGCDTVAVRVASSINQPQVYFVFRNFDQPVEVSVQGVVRASAPATHVFPVQAGDVLGVYLMVAPIVDFAPPGTVRGGLFLIDEYTYTGPPTC
jgi:hypothetical protein